MDRNKITPISMELNGVLGRDVPKTLVIDKIIEIIRTTIDTENKMEFFLMKERYIEVTMERLSNITATSISIPKRYSISKLFYYL